MAEHTEPQHSPEQPAAPAPNRRERRGGKSRASTPHGGKSDLPHRSTQATPPRQYSTRRRSG